MILSLRTVASSSILVSLPRIDALAQARQSLYPAPLRNS